MNQKQTKHMTITTQENTIWEGHPSQYSNVVFYGLCLLLTVAFGLGILLAIYKYYETKTNVITVTNQRIVQRFGILSKTTNEIELYRVRDIKYLEPFWLRIFGLSIIHLDSTDYTHPVFEIKGIKNGNEIKEKLRLAIENRRDLKGVREVEVS